MHFKAKLSDTRQFKWYINAGPNISYWLGGKGKINAAELVENGEHPLNYKIEFGDLTTATPIFFTLRMQTGFNSE